jgi:hypothetical protein
MLQILFGTIMADKSDLISHVVYSNKAEDVESEPNLSMDNQASVVVKLEMPDDSVISTADVPHNVPDFQESEIKTESIIHEHQICNDYSTRDEVRQTIESNISCVKHEYKFEDDNTHAMPHNVEP